MIVANAVGFQNQFGYRNIFLILEFYLIVLEFICDGFFLVIECYLFNVFG